ncbi:MAG: putative prolyl-tRNA synthetase, prolyl-tRNA synthetase [Candidatus Nomurabacteria bacterium]|jgi:prolyl-tRNA synthetase|nr:putative prolyl-tRNA synthetase, prolyl-tRNA synthetase [Candidatus Nomurabacteria bacterium]
MRQSQLFTKTSKDNPADEQAKNAQLLIRGGFIHKEMAGVYSMLPLGYRVMEKIVHIIKEEMDAIGGIQMKTSALQSKDVWEKTNRWDDEVVDNWFKTTLKNGTEVGLSFTNEEAYSNIVKNFVSSYKDLPLYPYDFKTIFRNEIRSKSGIMRGREFYWKALYSFSADKESHDVFYEKSKEAYRNVYNRVGLGAYTYMTFASGGTFSKYSHEFQTVSEAGEDLIYIDTAKGIAINKEVLTDEVLAELNIDRATLVEKKAIEVGNIFSLGSKFSDPFDLTYKNSEGGDVPVFMGSYGIGVTRLMGTVVEVLSDEKGIVWPESIAPFKVHLLQLGDQVITNAQEIYNQLLENNIEVLFDDRIGMSAGEKFADSDLLGMPHRVVVSERSLAQGGVEYKKRDSDESTVLSVESLIQQLIA